jgi:hypothetical protein
MTEIWKLSMYRVQAKSLAEYQDMKNRSVFHIPFMKKK